MSAKAKGTGERRVSSRCWLVVPAKWAKYSCSNAHIFLPIQLPSFCFNTKYWNTETCTSSKYTGIVWIYYWTGSTTNEWTLTSRLASTAAFSTHFAVSSSRSQCAQPKQSIPWSVNPYSTSNTKYRHHWLSIGLIIRFIWWYGLYWPKALVCAQVNLDSSKRGT